MNACARCPFFNFNRLAELVVITDTISTPLTTWIVTSVLTGHSERFCRHDQTDHAWSELHVTSCSLLSFCLERNRPLRRADPWPTPKPHHRRGSSVTRSPTCLLCDSFEGSRRPRLRFILECAVATNQFPAESSESRAPTALAHRWL